jgi:single-stranded-DNA-specific exonuclease
VAHCLAQHDARVLLAVDCGSTAVATVAGLNARGVDVLVLDHHQVSAPPPAALALVNPRLNGAPSHGTELCSAGLAFKLAHALVKRGRELGLAAAHRLDLKALLDLVALGTIADLVPLAGENRILVTAGLERLNETRRPGLQALCEVAGLRTRIGTHEVGYLLGPRLNAAGRLEDAREALDLLLAGDFALATPIAHSLDARNRQRQEIERGIAAQVVASLGQRFNPDTDFVIVEGELLWHIGVVGIVASRVLSQFYRPTIIVGGDGAHWRGSGRSIEGFDLAAALRECDDLLVRHGGHAMAAGLTIAADKLPALRTRLNDLARRTLAPEQLRPPLRLDAETDLAELGSERLHELARLAPTGQGNPPVQVVVRGLGLTREPQRIGAEKKHAKFWAGHGGGESVECVWWGCGERPLPAGRFDLACAPQLHAYNGREYVQLKVLDWRPA